MREREREEREPKQTTSSGSDADRSTRDSRRCSRGTRQWGGLQGLGQEIESEEGGLDTGWRRRTRD